MMSEEQDLLNKRINFLNIFDCTGRTIDCVIESTAGDYLMIKFRDGTLSCLTPRTDWDEVISIFSQPFVRIDLLVDDFRDSELTALGLFNNQEEIDNFRKLVDERDNNLHRETPYMKYLKLRNILVELLGLQDADSQRAISDEELLGKAEKLLNGLNLENL